MNITYRKSFVALLMMGSAFWSHVAWASKCGGVAQGGSTGGAYFSQGVPYEEDVFSFCAIGIPAHCWAPTGPGTWTQTCYYLNKKWIPKFEEVCVHGKTMGAWKATSSHQPLSTKGDPKSQDGMSTCEHGDDF